MTYEMHKIILLPLFLVELSIVHYVYRKINEHFFLIETKKGIMCLIGLLVVGIVVFYRNWFAGSVFTQIILISILHILTESGLIELERKFISKKRTYFEIVLFGMMFLYVVLMANFFMPEKMSIMETLKFLFTST